MNRRKVTIHQKIAPEFLEDFCDIDMYVKFDGPNGIASGNLANINNDGT